MYTVLGATVVVIIIMACVCEVQSAPWHVPWCGTVCEDALLNAERMCACSCKVLPGVIAHNRLKDPDKIQSVKWQGQARSCSATDPETWSRGRGEKKRGEGRQIITARAPLYDGPGSKL